MYLVFNTDKQPAVGDVLEVKVVSGLDVALIGGPDSILYTLECFSSEFVMYKLTTKTFLEKVYDE